LAVKIKLQRRGTKNKPFYRVVVQDESSPRNGRVIEVLGQYDALKNPSLFEINKDKTAGWLAKGAVPTDKVRILLGKAGVMPPVDLAALTKKRPKAELKKEALAAAEGKAKKEEAKPEAKVEAKVEAKPEAVENKDEGKNEEKNEGDKEGQA
jgi:small subunit ribosomal protein S16